MAELSVARSVFVGKRGLRSPDETQQTINFLLAELTKLQSRVDELEARADGRGPK